jgi:Na+/H+-dicarboxylate symporter
MKFAIRVALGIILGVIVGAFAAQAVLWIP